jgi:hypothetical protein
MARTVVSGALDRPEDPGILDMENILNMTGRIIN